MKHISWVYKVIKALPRSVVQWLSPALAGFVAEGDASRAQVEEILSGQNAEWRLQDHPTIFHAILDSKLEPHEKTVERLSEDAQTIVMAGAITIATTLELITFWLLTQPQTLRKLKD